ncbi:MAG: hypothetical protein Q8L87_20985 [Anaerolineales bacterium]|nr:hypothetical protein [Anaerolineales bacterium]
MKRTSLIAWTILRLPLLGLMLYLFRFQIAEFIERSVGLDSVMDFAVYSASTLSTRIFLYAGGVAMLWLGAWLAGKLTKSDGAKYSLSIAAAFLVVYISFLLLFLAPNALTRTAIITVIFAANILPYEWLAKRTSANKYLHPFFIAGIGFAEAFVPQSYFLWLIDQLRNGKSANALPPKWSWLAGVIIAPLFWIFLLTPFDNQRILTLGEKLHADPAVEKFAEGNFNWVELNAARRELYAVGLGQNFVLAFDVDNLNIPPRKSQTNIGKTQSFAFNPDLQEIYVYKNGTRELLYLDTADLKAFRSVPVPDLSGGDVWINWNRHTDGITIASEADFETGVPFVMFDRPSGEMTASIPMPLVPTNVAFHTGKPILYFNSFRDTYLVAWDMAEKKIIQQTETSPRTDRLAYSPNNSEILVASPLEGAILRYDAETLEFKGKIKTSLGDRTLTIDSKRNLMLVGNFINNRVQVIDLTTYEVLDSFYLGPWIRTIALDVENGIAYVSTIRNLFKVTYAQP